MEHTEVIDPQGQFGHVIERMNGTLGARREEQSNLREIYTSIDEKEHCPKFHCNECTVTQAGNIAAMKCQEEERKSGKPLAAETKNQIYREELGHVSTHAHNTALEGVDLTPEQQAKFEVEYPKSEIKKLYEEILEIDALENSVDKANKKETLINRLQAKIGEGISKVTVTTLYENIRSRPDLYEDVLDAEKVLIVSETNNPDKVEEALDQLQNGNKEDFNRFVSKAVQDNAKLSAKVEQLH